MARHTRVSYRRRLLHWTVIATGVLAFIGFVALGNWQLERRVWKLQLMQRVEARVDAPAEPAPGPERWPGISRDSDEYRHVTLSGAFLSNSDTLVVAATELGSGYWVLTPFRRTDGSIILVNRGFVAQGVTPAAAPKEEVHISGLLRLNEPGGGFLRDNDPTAGRWYSRDVQAIAAAQGLTAAPYFVDAAAGQPGSPGGEGPAGGLTVIRFHNSHLVYAITWYGLAAMVAGAAVLLRRESLRNARNSQRLR